MTKTKLAAAALAAITIATSMTAAAGEAQAKKWKPGYGIGLGIATGVLVGAAIASNAYAEPAYGYQRCHFVKEYDGYGYLRTVRVCRAPY